MFQMVGGRKKSINFALFIVISIITDTGRKRKKLHNRTIVPVVKLAVYWVKNLFIGL